MIANWPLSRIVFWVVVIGGVAWVISSPSHAGQTAAGLVQTVIGWGESFVSAAVTFIANVTR